ncbi:MAG: hypothetical protein IPJ20_05930 [Flammeovirgaceae bacterium]|nr:hypothetical protein [Flammeovirgaceae bacterium]
MEQSKKSVAVRKVLGASVSTIIVMMSKDFLKLVLIGMVIAAPIAYFVMNKWLDGFSYNVGFAWIVFIYAGLAGLPWHLVRLVITPLNRQPRILWIH